MQQPNAASKGNNQILYYHFLMFQRTRTLYSQTFSDTKPVAPRLRANQNALYSSPEIKVKSSRIHHFLV